MMAIECECCVNNADDPEHKHNVHCYDSLVIAEVTTRLLKVHDKVTLPYLIAETIAEDIFMVVEREVRKGLVQADD